jgi:hypothetical protein
MLAVRTIAPREAASNAAPIAVRAAPGPNGDGKTDRRRQPASLGDLDSARHVVGVSRTRQPLPKNIAKLLPPDWVDAEALALDEGEPGLETWLRNIRFRYRSEPARVDAFLQALETAKAEPPADGEHEDEAETPKPFDLDVIGSADFARRKHTREWLVNGILVKHRPGVVGGPKKCLKTSLLIDLVVSLAAALRFLGEFWVPRPTKVLLISGESGDAVIQETMRRVCRSKGIEPEDLEGFAYWGFTLPQLNNPDQLAALSEFIRANGIEVVIIDPLYLCLLTGGRKIDAANLFDVGPLLKLICDTCMQAGATPLLCHHFRKARESPYDPPEMEDLAFAAIQEYFRQMILVGRRSKFEPGSGQHQLWLSVGGSDGHSGEWALDVSEGITGEDFHDREWRASIVRAGDARAEARQQAVAAKQQTEAEKARQKAEQKETEDRKAMDQLINLFHAAPDRKLTAKTIRTKTGWRSDKAERIIDRLVTAGVLVLDQVPTVMGNGHTRDYPGFRLVEGVVQ